METILIVLVIILLFGIKISFTYRHKPKQEIIIIPATPIKARYRIVNTHQTDISLPGFVYYRLEKSIDFGISWKSVCGEWATTEANAKLRFNEYFENMNKKPTVIEELEA